MQRTIVVKIGGAAGNETEGLVRDLRVLTDAGHRIVVVHGGSAATTELADQLGRPSQFITSPSGQVSRRTDRPALEVFARATALINRTLVESLRAAGVDAFGLSGLDGAVVHGRRKPAVRSVENGKTRIIRGEWTGRPVGVRTEILGALLAQRLTCVFAPLIAGENGEMLNTDGDRLAAAIAAALGADDLVFLSNVPGLLRDMNDPQSLIPEITSFKAAEEVAQGRMRKKVMGAREAIEGGAGRVVFASSAVASPVILALRGEGTVFAINEQKDAAGQTS